MNLKTLKNEIEKFIEKHNEDHPENPVDESHGYAHFRKVAKHAKLAIRSFIDSGMIINDTEQFEILAASWLHDVDDAKYFSTENYSNARMCLEKIGCDSSVINNIIYMIRLVSSSKNGDTIPEGAKEIQLIPRYADRLEAIGKIGVQRCLLYTLQQGGPLFCSDTKRATTEEDLFNNVATEERYRNYKGKSFSFIDHFYDKILRLDRFPIRNNYFDEECKKRRAAVVEVALLFGQKGLITLEDVEAYIKN
ncbi:uncharacterized protein LOC101235329 [Hydra vulgaris]|uniref:Uncharacterized protein LOC101235329 n=1 Tax=Hydra vulgaris TaxID=6087 RepID=A0ABM4CV25_HYDVU